MNKDTTPFWSNAATMLRRAGIDPQTADISSGSASDHAHWQTADAWGHVQVRGRRAGQVSRFNPQTREHDIIARNTMTGGRGGGS